MEEVYLHYWDLLEQMRCGFNFVLEKRFKVEQKMWLIQKADGYLTHACMQKIWMNSFQWHSF